MIKRYIFKPAAASGAVLTLDINHDKKTIILYPACQAPFYYDEIKKTTKKAILNICKATKGNNTPLSEYKLINYTSHTF